MTADATQETRPYPAQQVGAFGTDLLVAAGMIPDEAATVSDLLVETSLRGVDSHGVVRYPIYARRCRAGGIISPAPVEWVSDNGATSLLDAGDGAGQVVGCRAVERVIDRAATHGVAAVGIRRSNHLGALASYSQRIADAGHIGLVMTNASPQIAPTGGAEKLLGNNPWSIAVPYERAPIIMDMANSVAARGKIRLHKSAGTPVPEGWARDPQGLPTTDPDQALAGLLEPIAGYKGYAIVFMVDVLCGVLMGARNGPEVTELPTLDRPMGVGHLFLAINIDSFAGRETYDAKLEQLVQRIRGTRLAPGVEAVHLPGDIERNIAEERSTTGSPVSRSVLEDYRSAADELGCAVPDWIEAAL